MNASFCMVKPAQERPNEVMALSDVDQATALTHVLLVHFYAPNSHLLQENAVQTLKDSLSKALVLFYPAAGRLQWTNTSRLELNCNSTGVPFVDAKSDATIGDFGDFLPDAKVKQLIPRVDYSQPIQDCPLLLVQVTRFKCGGLCLGWGISHVLGDGQSATHFLSEWARIARGEPPENPPVLDRRLLIPKEPLAGPLFDHIGLKPLPLLLGQSDYAEERNKETTVAMLRLTKEQVEKLKKKANEHSTSHNMGRPFSKYEAVAGHLWRCACKARRHKSEQTTCLRIAVDFRNRVEPNLPKGYFGNAIASAVAIAASGDLTSKPLAYTSKIIREAVKKMTNEYVKSYLESLRKEPDLSKFRSSHEVGSTWGIFKGNPNIEITSWITIPLQGADFGWGTEIYCGPANIGYDGKSYILDGRDEDGSLVIALRLQVAHMDALKRIFYEDILSWRSRC
ncbi:hypothetical protein NMG60_11025548 [Bertholletia excelsa]